MSEGTTAANHIGNFKGMVDQLRTVGITFSDEVQAVILLSSLPDSWDPTVTALSASTNEAPLKYNQVRDFVLGEELRRKGKEETSGLALRVENGKGRTRGPKSKGGKGSVKCYTCGVKGHYSYECPDKAKEDGARAAMVEDLGDALILSEEQSDQSWVLDSGASFHSCSGADEMEQYTPGDFGVVHLGDNQPLKVVGKGVVRIKTSSGAVLQLRDVQHVPSLKRKLISVGQLDKEGYGVTFNCGVWKITKGARVVARGRKQRMLYTTYNNIKSSGGSRWLAEGPLDGDINERQEQLRRGKWLAEGPRDSKGSITEQRIRWEDDYSMMAITMKGKSYASNRGRGKSTRGKWVWREKVNKDSNGGISNGDDPEHGESVVATLKLRPASTHLST